MWSFHRFLRRSVAENQPWDRFARSLITARGSNLKRGAANFFVLHRDPIDLAETTSMAFLGLSLTCRGATTTPWRNGRRTSITGLPASSPGFVSRMAARPAK